MLSADEIPELASYIDDILYREWVIIDQGMSICEMLENYLEEIKKRDGQLEYESWSNL